MYVCMYIYTESIGIGSRFHPVILVHESVVGSFLKAYRSDTSDVLA